MKRSKTSKAWMREHVNDHYVHKAKAEGYRARAAFKLLEIDEKDHLLKPGMTVVDLGSAPGSWCQIAAKKVGDSGKVIALDLLEMDPLHNVHFIRNFRHGPQHLRYRDCRPGARDRVVRTGAGFCSHASQAGRAFSR